MSKPPSGNALSAVQTLGRSGVTLAIIGAIMLVAMMGLTVFDVIGRYLFNSPIKGAAELTEILLCAVIFLGLGAVSLREDHVTVDLLVDYMPAWVHPIRQVLTGLFSGVILCVVGWRLWVYADQIGGYNGSTTNLSIPIAPLGYFCAICTVVGALITVAIPLKRFFAPPTA
ncbi:TRAP transporter small permease protein [Marivivens niveibacter]|uniref:TRAP transporter small permease protein n=1 Tax=Marivivens niveibacter TaxID=1930667 RepID=A0A251X0L9_9RHOB|nr:TRAP transporter small permease protein [Marivivens niveibacter]